MKRLELIKQQISNPTFTKLSIYYRNNIGYISMRSPKDLNCLSSTMMNELSDSLMLLENDSSVYVIVIVSELGKIFCAGADIKQFTKFDYENSIKTQPIHTLEKAIQKIKKPIISAVNGKALGGGFELALLTDIILASDKAYFGFPQINLGLFPGLGGTQRLSKIVGEKKAMRCILSGGGFSAQQAFNLNIAERVSGDNFNEEVQKVADELGSKSLVSLIVAKKAIKQSSNTTLDQGLDYEKALFYPIFGSKGVKEGLNAFLNKRKPNFKGL